MPPIINAMKKLTSLNETSRTMTRYSDGGALINSPNAFRPKVRVVPDLYLSSPAVSSLPYLSDDQKAKTNESILMLSVDIANKKEQHRNDWIYTDRENMLLQNNITGDITKFAKEFEPSTEQLLRNYISGELTKRKREEQAIESKRITGVDESFETFKQDIDNIRSADAIKRAEVLAEQETRAGRYHAEQLFRQSGMGGVDSQELERRFMRNKAGSSKPLERLEPPTLMVGMPSREQSVLDAIKSPANNERLQQNLMALYNTDLRAIKNSLSKLGNNELNSQILTSNLGNYLGNDNSRETKIDLIAYHRISQDPKFRRSLEGLNLPVPFAQNSLSPQQSTILDRLIASRGAPKPKPIYKGYKLREENLLEDGLGDLTDISPDVFGNPFYVAKAGKGVKGGTQKQYAKGVSLVASSLPARGKGSRGGRGAYRGRGGRGGIAQGELVSAKSKISDALVGNLEKMLGVKK